jgi:hypothetical protein
MKSPLQKPGKDGRKRRRAVRRGIWAVGQLEFDPFIPQEARDAAECVTMEKIQPGPLGKMALRAARIMTLARMATEKQPTHISLRVGGRCEGRPAAVKRLPSWERNTRATVAV